MFALLELCPQAIAATGPRWVERVWTGVRDASGEKDRMAGSAHTWTMASGEPERKKLDEGSTARDVTGCRCDVDVETRRPEQICAVLEADMRAICRPQLLRLRLN
jgi:hypothetical protein